MRLIAGEFADTMFTMLKQLRMHMAVRACAVEPIIRQQDVKKTRRGWTWEKRQSTTVDKATRDGGEHPKGTQKGNKEQWEPPDGPKKGGGKSSG